MRWLKWMIFDYVLVDYAGYCSWLMLLYCALVGEGLIAVDCCSWLLLELSALYLIPQLFELL